MAIGFDIIEFPEFNTIATEETTNITPERTYHVHFKAETPFNFLDAIGSAINRQTIMSGARNPWDRTRLIHGKLAELEKIGDLAVELSSTQGDKLSASHIYHQAFISSLQEHGGTMGTYSIKIDHPFFDIAKPISITVNKEKTIAGTLIPYSSKENHESNKLKELQAFLSKANLIAVCEHSLSPITKLSPNSLYSNILILHNSDYKKLKETESNSLEITESESYHRDFQPFFDKNYRKSDVIRFDNSHPDFLITLEKLKINKSPWTLIQNGQESILIKSTSPLIDILFEIDRLEDPIFQIKFSPSQEDSTPLQSPGVIILSMNQSNSYTQYTHEILTFLLLGMDVFAYDNAGKGLSEGSLSQEGLKTAIKLSGLYLKERGYQEDQLLFKGQCAGGLPSSEAVNFFPKSHVWIDQSPNEFPSVATDIVVALAKDNPRTSKLYAKLESSVEYIKPAISFFTQIFLPTFNVVENVQKNTGLVIYSIGVPDAKNKGGDALVPKEHTSNLIQQLGSQENSVVILPIVGGTHVTDWWIDPELLDKVHRTLQKHQLTIPVFPSDKPKNGS